MAKYYQAHDSSVTALTTTPSGALVLAGFDDGKVRQFSIKNNDVVFKQQMPLSSRSITDLKLNLFNGTEFVMTSGNLIGQFDYVKNELVRKLTDDRGWIVNTCCKFFTDSVIVVCDNNSSLKFVDLRLRSNRPIQEFKDSKDTLSCVDFSPREKHRIYCGSNDGFLYSYDLRNEKVIIDRCGEKSVTSVSVCSFLKKSSVLVSCLCQSSKIVEVDANSAANFVTGYNENPFEFELKTVRQYSKKIEDCQFQTDTFVDTQSKRIISGSETGEVYIWDVDDGSTSSASSASFSYGKILKTYDSYMVHQDKSSSLLSKVSYLSNIDTILAGAGDGKFHWWKL